MLIENLELKGKECREIFVSCKNGQSFQYVVHNFINELYLTGIACVKKPQSDLQLGSQFQLVLLCTLSAI